MDALHICGGIGQRTAEESSPVLTTLSLSAFRISTQKCPPGNWPGHHLSLDECWREMCQQHKCGIDNPDDQGECGPGQRKESQAITEGRLRCGQGMRCCRSGQGLPCCKLRSLSAHVHKCRDKTRQEMSQCQACAVAPGILTGTS